MRSFLVTRETAGAALYEERPVMLLPLIAWSDPADECEFLIERLPFILLALLR